MRQKRNICGFLLSSIMAVIFAIAVPISGYANELSIEFQTDSEYITRAEFVDMVYTSMDETSKKKCYINVNAFADVNSDAWYNEAVSSLANAGVIFGNRCGKFLADRNIKRAEAVTILARLDDISDASDDYFEDISSHWAKSYINAACAAGWLTNSTDTFEPEQYITKTDTEQLLQDFFTYQAERNK